MKSLFKKIISLVMAFALFLQWSGITQAAAYSSEDPSSENAAQIADPEHIADTVQEPEMIGEVVGLREENVKHFRMSDGSFKAFSYGYPVHYLDESDTWQDINNVPVLVSNEKGVDTYRVENADHTTSFASALEDGKILSTSFENMSVAISLLDLSQAQALTGETPSVSAQARVSPDSVVYNRNASAQPEANSSEVMLLSEDTATQSDSYIPENLRSSILYEDVFPGVDYRYTTWSYNIKEEIIVKELQDSYRYDFFLELDNLVARSNDNGSVSLLNNENVEVFYIPAPYMMDASGEISYLVTYRLTSTEDGIVLTVEADSEWIESDSRTLPVTIDPSITTRVSSATHTAADDIYATYVHPAYPNGSLYNTDYLYTGYSGNYLSSPYITYLYFNNIPEIPTGCIVSEARLKMLLVSYSNAGSSSMPIGMFPVTDPIPAGLTAHSWISGLTYSNKPSYDTTNIIDFASTSSSKANSYLYWDITNLAREWYAGSNNRMVALDAVGSFGSSGYAAQSFRSTGDAVSPVMEVTYRSSYGIEAYYSYQTLSAGEAGTAYIADSTGQLKVVTNILGYNSEVNPFSLNLVYNSDYFNNSTDNYLPPSEMGLNMSVGAGWTLDCIQTISDETIGVDYYLKHRDGDGTIHYYKKPYSSENGEFYDEDGLGLTMKQVGTNSYRINDHLSNYRLFTNNTLTEISDWDGNKIYINYTGGKITSITQKNDGSTEITLAAFAYSGNNVSSVTDAAGNVYSFEYENGNLKSIRKNNASIAEFTYSGYRVATMKDSDSKYKLQFTYDSMDRISGFSESVEGTTGAQINIEYPGKNHVAYIDPGSDRVFGNGNDLRYNYLFDHAGRTINAYTTDENNKVHGASMGVYTEDTSTSRKTNHVLRSASTGVVAQQLLRNTSLESGNWTHDGTSVSTDMPRTGTKSIKGTAANASSIQYAQTSSESLTAGKTYTFSAYVKTDNMTFSGKGIYLKVTDSAGTTWSGEPVDYDASGIAGGWARLSVTFTASRSGAHTVAICREGVTGTFYADDFQLEEGEAPSNHNLVENGNMLSNSAWTLGTGASISDGTLKITGDGLSTATNASQVIPLNLPYGQTYVLSGWAKANAAPDTAYTHSDPAQDTCKQFGLRAILTYSGGTKEYHYIPFNTDVDQWQFVSLAIVPQREETVASIQIVCAYEQNIRTAQFDNISLIREVAQQMEYDDNGCLLSVTSTDQATDKDTYNGYRLLTKRETAASGTYYYTYADPTNAYRASSVTNGLVTESFVYNTTGNLLSTTVTGSDGSKIITSSTYTADGNRVATVTDAAGATVTYGYAAYEGTTGAGSEMLGLPTSVTAPNGAVTRTAYDNFGRVTKTDVAQLATLLYTYTEGRLNSIQRTNSQNVTQTYNFDYDSFGNTTAIKVGTRVLAEYDYYANNGLLKKQTYGNGHTVSYVYDNLGRTKTVTHAGGRTLTYTYTGDGQLYSVTEAKPGSTTPVVYRYLYDSVGRVVQSERISDGAPVRQYQSFNDANQIISSGWQIGSDSFDQSYTYDTRDGSIATMTLPNGKTLTYGYDGLRRLSTVNNSIFTRTYGYAGVGTNTNQTSNQVKSLVYSGTADAYSYGYTYDSMGNITDYTAGDSTTTYTYDTLGQLLGADTNGDGVYDYAYTYDSAGNLLVVNGHQFTYGDAGWTDLLTAYDGEAITYDSIGNPTSYYNGTRWSFDWVEGRRLNEASTSGNEDVTISYSYDSDGLRMGKTVTTQEYVKNGLYVDSDGETRYYEDGVATYAGLVAVDGYFYYFNSSMVAVRNNPAYSISKTNDILPGGTYAFDAQGRMYNLPTPATNNDGSVKNGLLTDDDGQIRYYVNGYDSYAGLVYVGGYYYYINSSRTAVRNCQYYTTKHNDLLPAGTYTFDANGRMTNPPATASVYATERATVLATIVTDYDYTYIGSQLAQMVISTTRNNGTPTTETLNFAYDASGTPATVSYNGVTYYYITNLQGDVMAIVDSNGATLVEYEYDPYGRLRSMSGVMSTTLGEANPLRYRGYVYDSETRLYYLQSRYYDPKICRFINADSYASTGQGILGHNMFAYCNNNPVMGYDPSGLVNWGGVLAGLVLGVIAVAAVAVTVATAGAASPVLAAAGCAIGTAMSAALVESAVVTTVGAVAEAPVVYDVTVVGGTDRVGASFVYDFGENTSDFYLHTGKQSKEELGATFGTGFVYNYDEPGDYAGEFLDVSASSNYKGASLGIDYCTSPSNLTNGYQDSHAMLVTSGLSWSPNNSKMPTFSYDFYWPIS